MRNRTVIFVCDGLRPDRIDPVRTPNLWRLRGEGVWYRNSRTVFPSETRVAAASMVTGCLPGMHGIVSNDFFDPEIIADRPIATADADDLAAVARGRGGRLLARATLAERTLAAGLRYAAVSTASAGTSRILADGAAGPNAFIWSPHASVRHPVSVGAAMEERFGPVPAHDIPRTGAIAHAARIFCEHVLRELRPDLAIFWSGEPDSTYHYRGIGSSEAAEAERASDDALGMVMAEADGAALLVVSDHGHITGHTRLDLRTAFLDAGFAVAAGAPVDGEIVVVPGAATSVYCSGTAEPGLSAWLAEQAWCGAVFSRASARGFFDSDVGRSADLVFTLHSDDAEDSNGVIGRAYYDADLPVGCGMHGGLHPFEMSNVLIVSGGAFRKSTEFDLPAGLTDLAPTVAQLLDLAPVSTAGRVLEEALATSRAIPTAFRTDWLTPDACGKGVALRRSIFKDVQYIDGLVSR